MTKDLKQRLYRHPFVAMGGYLILYMLYFGVLEAWRRPCYIVHSALDDYIPFCRFAVVPYVMWFAWVPALLLLFLYRARGEFWRLFKTIALGTASSLAFYTVFPTAVCLRRWHPETDVFTRLVKLIYAADTSTNVCPSLHVFVTLAIALAVFDSAWTKPLLRHVTAVLSTAICLSTVLLDQHSVVDVILGALLAVAAYALCSRRTAVGAIGPRPQPRRALPARRAE